MNSKTIITVLTSIIIIQMITGLYIINRTPVPSRQGPFVGMMEDSMGPGKHHMRGNRFGKHFCEPGFMESKLSLTQEQTEKITMLNKKFEEDFTAFNSRIEPERDRLKRMLDENIVDINAVKNQLKKIEDINTEIHLLRIKQGIEISGILTPGQMKILRNERKLFFEKMRVNPDGFK